MTFPITVTFRNMMKAGPIEEEIRAQAEALGRWYDRIHRCRVVVELPHQHHREGRRVAVRVEVAVPGEEIVASHEGSPHPVPEGDRLHKGHEADGEHQHVRVAVRDAFDRARRRLQEFARRQRGDVKAHARP